LGKIRRIYIYGIPYILYKYAYVYEVM
jgi:hypothetical protein